MDEDLFISVLKSLPPQTINYLSKKPIEAQCIFTQQPDCQDDQQFIQASFPAIFQIRQNYIVECEPKSRKISGGVLLSLDYKFEVKRYANQSEFQLGKPYGFVLYFPQEDQDDQQIAIKLGVKPKAYNNLQKFVTCLGTKLIYQLDVHSNFKVIQRIYVSTAATLYSAIRLSDKKQVIIKCIKKDMITMTGRIVDQVIVRQYGIPKSLPHKNICQYFGLYINNDSVYIVMQKLHVNFWAYLTNKLFKSLKQLRGCFQKICQAVSVLHNKCIMHRDIKPQNIMIRKKQDLYQPVLIDFGLAQYEQKKPYIFNRCGTPGYAAPQIIASKLQFPDYDRGCDVFSLGCILHILLVRRSIFEGANFSEVLDKNVSCQIDKTHQKYKDLSPIQKDLLFRMVQKDPKKRIKIQQVIIHPYFQFDKNSVSQVQTSKTAQQSDMASNQVSETNNQCEKP